MIPVRPSLDPARFQREPWRDVDAARGMARPPVRRPARQDRQWVSLRCGSVSIGFNGRCEFAIARKAGPARPSRGEDRSTSPLRRLARRNAQPEDRSCRKAHVALRRPCTENRSPPARPGIAAPESRSRSFAWRWRLLSNGRDGWTVRRSDMRGSGRGCSRQNPLAPATILADLARVLIPDVGTLHRSRRPLPGTGAAGRGYLGVSIPRRLP